MVLLFGSALSAHGVVNDLLLLPAEKSECGANSILMDVEKFDGRLVTVGERGHILFKDEASEAWVQAEVPVSVTLTAVCLPSLEKGWAVGHEGVVLHTQDGGRTWVKQLDGRKINELVYHQLEQMIEDKTGLLESEEAGLTEEEREKLEGKLEDLGYFLKDAALAVQEGPVQPIMDVWFKDDREGIIVGSFGMILGTGDGGMEWTALHDRIENPNGFHYYGITRSGDNLFIAGEAGGLYRSKDFGQTWQQLESPYEGSFFGVTGSPEGDFIGAFGLKGNICYSLDEGESWQHTTVGGVSLSGGAWLSDASLCVVGVDGSIYISHDKARTFTSLPTQFPGSIAVAESSKGVLTIVGLKGTIRVDLEDREEIREDDRRQKKGNYSKHNTPTQIR